MSRNLWMEHASVLADAYARSGGTIRFELVTRSLLMHMATGPQRVADIGGGFGRQAIMLAQAGHHVSVMDLDPNMLAIAREQLASEPESVRSRIEFFLGDGSDAVDVLGTGFDLVCCHSVLMYEEDPGPILATLVRLARDGGLISLLSLNTEARAMRSGLQGRWRETATCLQTGMESDSRCLPTYEHSRAEIVRILEAAGAITRDWYGIGVFTDHLTDKLVVEDPEEVYLAEWLAGKQDPYRQVARCFHLIAQRTYAT